MLRFAQADEWKNPYLSTACILVPGTMDRKAAGRSRSGVQRAVAHSRERLTSGSFADEGNDTPEHGVPDTPDRQPQEVGRLPGPELFACF